MSDSRAAVRCKAHGRVAIDKNEEGCRGPDIESGLSEDLGRSGSQEVAASFSVGATPRWLWTVPGCAWPCGLIGGCVSLALQQLTQVNGHERQFRGQRVCFAQRGSSILAATAQAECNGA